MTPPSKINLNKAKTVLTVTFDDIDYELTSEFLRVYSPSAEVVGHGPGQETLQVGKENVTITNIQPTGNYAVFYFSVMVTTLEYILGLIFIILQKTKKNFGMNIC